MLRPLARAARAGARASSSAAAAAPEVTVRELGGDNAGVAVLTLSRPRARNALSASMLAELTAALGGVAARAAARGGGARGLRALVVASDVPGVFCAGADLRERARMTPDEAARAVRAIRAAFAALAALPLPTVAAIEGAALGGGLELALACDARVAGAAATLGLPEAALGIVPGAGGLARLPRVVGLARAKDLIFSARRVGADEALRLGLVSEATAEGDALEVATTLARAWAAAAPVALAAAKEALDAAAAGGDAADAEERAYGRVIGTRDRLEGLAAFAEKRAPVYTGE